MSVRSLQKNVCMFGVLVEMSQMHIIRVSLCKLAFLIMAGKCPRELSTLNLKPGFPADWVSLSVSTWRMNTKSSFRTMVEWVRGGRGSWGKM